MPPKAGDLTSTTDAGRPYNLNFLNSKTQKGFYSSQLAYKSYLCNGINLNTGKAVPLSKKEI